MDQKDLIYPNEKSFFNISFLIATVFWGFLLFSFFSLTKVLPITFAHLVIALLILSGFLYFVSIIAQSFLVTHLKGNSVAVSNEQFPEIYSLYTECCEKLGFKIKPKLYLLESGGLLNAFATKFIKSHYVVLNTAVVEAFESKPSALKFYIGHELGHIKRNHLFWHIYLRVNRALPILGAAYSRACEYTCDRHGLFCCDEPRDAVYALSVLSAGKSKWKTLNYDKFMAQDEDTSGFWTSFHELRGDYPWLCKRVAHVHALGSENSYKAPKRSKFAWFIALITPGPTTVFVIYTFVFASFGSFTKNLQGIENQQPKTNTSINSSLANSVAESVSYGNLVINKINEYYDKAKKFPQTIKDLGLTQKNFGPLVKNVIFNEEKVSMTFVFQGPKEINDKTAIYYLAEAQDKNYYWYCDKGTLTNEFRPEICHK